MNTTNNLDKDNNHDKKYDSDSEITEEFDLPKKIIEVDGLKIIEIEKYNIFIIENILENDFCDYLCNIIDNVPNTKTYYNSGNNVECYVSSLTQLIDKDNSYFYPISLNEESYNNLLTNSNNKSCVCQNAF